QEGVVTRWVDERGFGFITPATGGPPVFAHVTAFPPGMRPVPGEIVTFRTSTDDRNRLRASDVEYVGRQRPRPINGPVRISGAVAVLFLALLAALAMVGLLPVALPPFAALASVTAVLLYWADTSAATRGAWRVSESTLHVVSVLGGWPGALIAQQVFRHKTRKQPFRTIFWATVVLNCAAVAYVAILRPIPF
ncbi:MAG TPA: cold shock and DUF1294 domain-containing protein, partial [Propionibacteriaceae bacterium]|nr:cold shock and DUF1294 domain-containing protein [Propionibacteriaceae bacterium]